MPDRHAAAAAHERRAQEARLGQRALQQALGRIERDAQAEGLVARALAIDERPGAELVGEAPELAARRGPLLEVDEVHGDPALLEEALRLARRHAKAPGAGGAGDALGVSSAREARRRRSSAQALSGTGWTPGCRTP